jgi:hypothetical protein
MNGDVHVRFWEGPAVQFRGPTRPGVGRLSEQNDGCRQIIDIVAIEGYSRGF